MRELLMTGGILCVADGGLKILKPEFAAFRSDWEMAQRAGEGKGNLYVRSNAAASFVIGGACFLASAQWPAVRGTGTLFILLAALMAGGVWRYILDKRFLGSRSFFSRRGTSGRNGFLAILYVPMFFFMWSGGFQNKTASCIVLILWACALYAGEALLGRR